MKCKKIGLQHGRDWSDDIIAKRPKVLSTYSEKQAGIISSNKKGVFTTIICVVSQVYSFCRFLFLKEKGLVHGF